MQKAQDEVSLRKTVIDSMGDNLLKHEDDSMRMAQKLTLMKNQIMEYDRYVGMNRKYGAVRIQTMKNTPVTVSFFNLDIFSSNLCKMMARRIKKQTGFFS